MYTHTNMCVCYIYNFPFVFIYVYNTHICTYNLFLYHGNLFFYFFLSKSLLNRAMFFLFFWVFISHFPEEKSCSILILWYTAVKKNFGHFFPHYKKKKFGLFFFFINFRNLLFFFFFLNAYFSKFQTKQILFDWVWLWKDLFIFFFFPKLFVSSLAFDRSSSLLSVNCTHPLDSFN